MTSIVPASTPQLYSHLNPCVYKKKCTVEKDSIENTIHTNENFSIFSCILKKSGVNIFNDCYNYTVFVPSNEYLQHFDYNSIDRSTARQIVLSSTLKEIIPSEILMSSPISYHKTLNSVQNLIISTDDYNLFINANSSKCIKVIKGDLEVCNGIIHVTNNIIIPYII